MNIFSIIGFIIAIIVLITGLKLSSEDMTIFLDYPSAFIVLGGTFAATTVCYQLNRLASLLKIFFSHIVGSKKIKFGNAIAEIMSAIESYRNGESAEQVASKVRDSFFKEAILIVADGFITDQDHILKILDKRINANTFRRIEDANKIKFLSKFPPAFGMMGTTIGMIVLLANLGGEDAIKMIGPAMGVCLITTLYGVVIANLAIIPIGENLTQAAKEEDLKNRIILEGVRHFINKSNPVLVAEELNSFLRPQDRLDWKSVIKK